MDIEKAKNDIIYFLEQTSGAPLSLWQKDLLAKHEQGEVISFNGYRNGKNSVRRSIQAHLKFVLQQNQNTKE
jgi:hypothetical protein